MLRIAYDYIHFSNSIITHNCLIYGNHSDVVGVVATFLHSYRSEYIDRNSTEQTDFEHESVRNVCRISAQMFSRMNIEQVNSERTSITDFFLKKQEYFYQIYAEL